MHVSVVQTYESLCIRFQLFTSQVKHIILSPNEEDVVNLEFDSGLLLHIEIACHGTMIQRVKLGRTSPHKLAK